MVTENVPQAGAISLLLKDIVGRLNKSYGPEKLFYMAPMPMATLPRTAMSAC